MKTSIDLRQSIRNFVEDHKLENYGYVVVDKPDYIRECDFCHEPIADSLCRIYDDDKDEQIADTCYYCAQIIESECFSYVGKKSG